MLSNPDITLSELRTYTLTLHGEPDAKFAPTFCPPETAFVRDGKTLKFASLRLDQSGLTGLLRQLHNLGCVVLAPESEKESV
jgi:hypothetical protein